MNDERAQAVQDAYEGPVTVATPSGEVDIENIEKEGNLVQITVNGASGGDPLFRIENPPTLVPDPFGDRTINGIRYREDPIAAVAFVIAQNGGAQDKAKDRLRGRR